MDFSQLSELAKTIDDAIDNKDEKTLNNIIEVYTDKKIENINNSKIKIHLYYYLSNIWSALKDIKVEKENYNIWNLEQNELFKSIYYLRKSILIDNFNEIQNELKISIFTNLANNFNHYGRTINALKYYNKALKVNSYYPMSLINKAICLETYMQYDYDINHQHIMIKYIYSELNKAKIEFSKYLSINIYDKGYYLSIYNNIISKINYIKSQYPINWLEESIELIDNLEFNKLERKYRDWVLKNKLFLNTLNDIENLDLFAQDPLTLPSITVSTKDGFPKYISYFNQIKQEFITYRYLIYEGLNIPIKSFYSKDTYIINYYNSNLYNIDIEKIKLAFRGFYSLFDKIANFINEYFNLGLDNKQVDYRKVWYKNNSINPIFNSSKNLAIRALYLISKDLYFNNRDENSKKFIEVLEPEAQEINKIRNHLEHKFIMIKDTDLDTNEDIFYITRKNLYSKTLHLAKLARETIFYLSFAVNIEEVKRDTYSCKALE